MHMVVFKLELSSGGGFGFGSGRDGGTDMRLISMLYIIITVYLRVSCHYNSIK